MRSAAFKILNEFRSAGGYHHKTLNSPPLMVRTLAVDVPYLLVEAVCLKLEITKIPFHQSVVSRDTDLEKVSDHLG